MTEHQTAARFRAAVAVLPSTAPVSELRRLWIVAAHADEALTAAGNADDFTWSRLERAQQATRQELMDHLLNEHGLTSADLRRSPL